MNLFRRQLLPGLGLNVKIMLTLSLILLGFALVSGGTFALIQVRNIKRHLINQGELMATMLSGSLQAGLFFENPGNIDQAVTSLLGLRLLHQDLQAVAVYDVNQSLILRKLTQEPETPSAKQRLVAPMSDALAAFRQNPQQGSIHVRSWLAAGKVHILFRDSGPGIAPEVMDRLFEPFFTTKETGQGTGQGLSISHSIIQKHQGEILVRSEVGQGPEFEIIPPLKQHPGAETRGHCGTGMRRLRPGRLDATLIVG